MKSATTSGSGVFRIEHILRAILTIEYRGVYNEHAPRPPGHFPLAQSEDAGLGQVHPPVLESATAIKKRASD